MADLVALCMPGGPIFVDHVRRAWDSGDAVLPVDSRLPHAAAERILDALAPASVVAADGTSSRRGSWTHPLPVEPGDALVVATSGTTGAPKGVVLTHDAVRASATATSSRLGIDPERHRWLACLPVAHIGGLSVITRALCTDTPLDAIGAFDVDAVTDAARRGATHTSLVATALSRVDPELFERILLGGASAPPDPPPNCVVTYGMTETGSGIWYDGAALDGVEVRVVDGEIEVRGPMLLRAYRDGTDPKDSDGWLATGDLGNLVDGRLVVDGRRGDIVVSGGQNVWPAPVETALLAHPKVADVAVVGRPDSEWGHVVTAVVVPTDPHDAPTVDELRDSVRDALAHYQLPRRVEVVAELPRTALGKLRRSSI